MNLMRYWSVPRSDLYWRRRGMMSAKNSLTIDPMVQPCPPRRMQACVGGRSESPYVQMSRSPHTCQNLQNINHNFQNFIRGCIEADFLRAHMAWCVLQHFSSSIIFAHICAAPNLNVFKTIGEQSKMLANFQQKLARSSTFTKTLLTFDFEN